MIRWARQNDFDDILSREAVRWNLPLPLLKAIIAVESGFNPRAYRAEAPRPSLPPTTDFPNGGDASYGLMQLLVRTARGLGFTGAKEELFDPATNVRYGAQLLSQNLRRAPVLADSVSAYNGGFRPALGYGSPLASGVYANQEYVNKVLAALRYFEGQEGGAGDGPAPFRLTPPDRPGDLAWLADALETIARYLRRREP